MKRRLSKIKNSKVNDTSLRNIILFNKSVKINHISFKVSYCRQYYKLKRNHKHFQIFIQSTQNNLFKPKCHHIVSHDIDNFLVKVVCFSFSKTPNKFMNKHSTRHFWLKSSFESYKIELMDLKKKNYRYYEFNSLINEYQVLMADKSCSQACMTLNSADSHGC